MPKGEKTPSLEESAIYSGVRQIIQANPRLRGKEGTLFNYIDQEKISARLEEIKDSLGPGVSQEDAVKYAQKELSSYISSGSGLTREGQELVLGTSLEGKTGFFSRLFPTKGQKYLNKRLDAFREIYDILKTGDYQNLPSELVKSVVEINNAGFFDTIVDILNRYGNMSKGKYHALKQSLTKKVEEASQGVMKEVEDYLAPKTKYATASVFGIIGAILIIFSGLQLTGASIGAVTDPTAGFVTGITSIVVSGILFLKRILL